MAICGIAVTDRTQAIESSCVQAMASMMARGSANACAAPGASFGMASATGTTSVYCSDSVMVACDADLYNRQELEKSILSLPLRATNAALIAALYLQQGQSLTKQLRGAFSLAIWDPRSESLLLARDRFGVKPLCYATNNTEFIFASHPRGIFASRRVSKKVALRAVVNYLNYNIVPAPDTAFEGVTKIKPGECLLWKAGKVHLSQYWELQYSEDAHGSVEQLESELLYRIEEAVRVTSADLDTERVGCFLSGGTDSSTVVGLLSRIQKQPAKTFSIGFAENRFNELGYARLAVKHFKAQHFEAILNPEHA